MSQTNITVRRRAAALLLGCTAVFILLGLRLTYLQLFKGNRFQQEALEQRFRQVMVDPKRGAILDRNGRKLAVSVHSDGLICNPREVRNPDQVALTLGHILMADAVKIKELITKKAMFVWISRRITPEQAAEIRRRSAELPGIQVAVRSQRHYPKETLAAQLLGITGIDNQGLEGLESWYDQHLKGTPGSDMAEFDTRGVRIPGSGKQYVEPIDGSNLILTIDERLQFIAERELDKAMRDTSSLRGLILMMDPKTGEILACATRPTFDPNEFAKHPPENRRNFVLTDQFEPGSTFKVITTAAALEEGAVRPEDQFFDPGFIRVEDRNIRCHKAGGHGSQTFTEAIENSCNPVFATLALKMGVDNFYKYIEAFGFGSLTGVDFPGEAKGKLMSKKTVGPVELANIGFGQGVSVSPLQLLSAVSAIANGGLLMQPHFVREVQAVGGTSKRFEPKPIRQVISTRTASTMAALLESVVVNGSGNRAYLEGFRVAGKTGTAQKPKGGRYGEGRLASFVGFAPADDPRIAMLVILDEPQTAIKYGGVLAAPVFGAVMHDSLRYLGVLPRMTDKNEAASAKEVVVPNLLRLGLGEAQGLLQQKSLSWRLIESGSIVMDQFPRPGARVNAGTRVLIYFDHEENLNTAGFITVPNLNGLSFAQANESLKALGLVLIASGYGVAANQHPAAGTKLPKGAKVVVEFKPPAP